MVVFVVICLGLVSYLTLRILFANLTCNIRVAHAGKPDSNQTNIRKVVSFKNRPIYREGDKEIDVSNLIPLIIEGHSLEPLGIKDNSTIYVEKKEKIDDAHLDDLVGRFIVLNIDNARTLKEHPLDNVLVKDGLKVRKVIDIVDTKLAQADIKSSIESLMSHDCDFENYERERKNAFVDRIIAKYSFASDYYNEEKKLIISVTYKHGKEKDLSFHSSKYLFGIVRYNTI